MSEQESRPSWPHAAHRVLLVDDEEDILRSVGRVLALDGAEVVTASSGGQAITVLDGARFDVVMTDLGMPGMTGLELLRAVRERDLDVPVVILTGSPSVQSAIDAMEHGAMQYLVKPIAPDQLRACVLRATKLGSLARAKRDAMAAMAHSAVHAIGDRATLEATFARTMTGVWSAFQPIVRADGSPYGYEALLRSREPALPHPGAVLDAAEKLGLVAELGRHMRALAAQPVIGAPNSGVLFVNLHPRDLFDPELTSPSSPLAAIADRVVLEVTERASIEGMEKLRSRIAEIRACGFRLAIDDLGAGYAGLSAFAALEPDVVKLDMSLTRDVDSIPTKRKLVASMCRLCRELGMMVVAEGVESDAELRCVIELGVDLVQGYLVARPGPAFPGYVWPDDMPAPITPRADR